MRKGLDRKPRLLALQRARADLEGQRVTTMGSSARTRELIVATRAELAALTSERAQEVATGLAEARAEASELRAQVRAARDRLQRAVIRAPVAGTVVELQLRTIGGCAEAGRPGPRHRPARRALDDRGAGGAADIDVVHAGLAADVHLLAYNSRHLPRIRGEVVKVSADRLTDANTGEPYYTAQIVVDKTLLARVAPGRLAHRRHARRGVDPHRRADHARLPDRADPAHLPPGAARDLSRRHGRETPYRDSGGKFRRTGEDWMMEVCVTA